MVNSNQCSNKVYTLSKLENIIPPDDLLQMDVVESWVQMGHLVQLCKIFI